jgi:hypothetical protein
LNVLLSPVPVSPAYDCIAIIKSLFYMQMRKLSAAATILGIILCVAACSKTGPTGPQGATGAAGAAGTAGAQGPAGPQGPAGAANVFTDTFTVANAGWAGTSLYWYSYAPNSSLGFVARFHDQAFSKVTQGILDTGMVLVYFVPYESSPNEWTNMPYVFLGTSEQFYYNYQYDVSPGKVRLWYFYTPNGSYAIPTTLSTDVIATHRYKIVAVSGTISTAMKRDRVDVGDYNQVITYLNLSN